MLVAITGLATSAIHLENTTLGSPVLAHFIG